MVAQLNMSLLNLAPLRPVGVFVNMFLFNTYAILPIVKHALVNYGIIVHLALTPEEKSRMDSADVTPGNWEARGISSILMEIIVSSPVLVVHLLADIMVTWIHNSAS
jgi:hypothetical protein